MDGKFGSRPLREVFNYEKGWELPNPDQQAGLRSAMDG
jgi:hypothetical protein